MDNQRASLAAHLAPVHTAVLVVAVQPMFTSMPLLPAVAEVLPRLRRFLDAARAAGVPRVFIRHVIPEDRWTGVWQQQHAGRTLQAALAPGSSVNAFAPGFQAEPEDLVVIKQRDSGFVGTDLTA
ncbi:MAG: hypothetical protein AVDCRST_MAG88-1553 [uncultured Thermomicrobiales bacterium]|uniref:Isochorismatase-like domain-containing protein n=1 Tax=uncultured Thermomicrobiales bacterium TaxID=1645740 RepID=A0A6J4UW43_9BACT|nr:MAG: hypothetical protein AVDCRST_MAG88-1553 [uncultured Thermomicrobiales bacterium]